MILASKRQGAHAALDLVGIHRNVGIVEKLLEPWPQAEHVCDSVTERRLRQHPLAFEPGVDVRHDRCRLRSPQLREVVTPVGVGRTHGSFDLVEFADLVQHLGRLRIMRLGFHKLAATVHPAIGELKGGRPRPFLQRRVGGVAVGHHGAGIVFEDEAARVSRSRRQDAVGDRLGRADCPGVPLRRSGCPQQRQRVSSAAITDALST